MTATSGSVIPALKLGVYIDAENLGKGFGEAGMNDCLWLNPLKLGQFLTVPDESLTIVKYFYSPLLDLGGRTTKEMTNRNHYISVLKDVSISSPLLQVIAGRYQMEPIACHRCNETFQVPNEKRTDVNLASHLVADAMDDLVDRVILISADADMVGALQIIRERCPHVRICLITPPKRPCQELTSFIPNENKLSVFPSQYRNNLLPDPYVFSGTNFPRPKPPEWVRVK
jgi:hypothetical protein